nr:hypothetical protein [Candidatus Sigynarchaeota archaeon]
MQFTYDPNSDIAAFSAFVVTHRYLSIYFPDAKHVFEKIASTLATGLPTPVFPYTVTIIHDYLGSLPCITYTDHLVQNLGVRYDYNSDVLKLGIVCRPGDWSFYTDKFLGTYVDFSGEIVGFAIYSASVLFSRVSSMLQQGRSITIESSEFTAMEREWERSVTPSEYEQRKARWEQPYVAKIVRKRKKPSPEPKFYDI